MNKKGFTLMEIIVVIALLGAIMLLVVPNITKNFKDSKKRLFYDNVVSLYTSAGRSFLLLDNPSNKTFSNSGNTLDVDVSEDITYKIVVNSYGEVTSMYVTNGTYSYSKSNSNGIKKKDIKLDDIIEGTGDEDVSAKVTLFDKLLEDNPTISERTDFNTTFTETNTGTLYKATESIASSPAKDVYYFAGNAKNNWVKFGKYQTDKVVYRGYYSATSSSYKEYLTMDACSTATSYNKNCTEYIYWNKDNDIYWRIIRTNADGSVRLLYSGNSFDTTGGYIGESAFNSINKDSMYVGYMYGTSGSLDNNRTNENNSTIKTYVDNWYSNNLTSYSKYISTEAVYCNDREVGSGTYSANGSQFNYASSTRVATNKTPTYNCTNIKDAFSGSNIQAKLTYPIGLMTADEVAYAGGKAYTNLTSPYAWYYLNSTGGSITGGTGSAWWSLSPFEWYKSEYGTFGWTVNYYPGRLAHAEDDSSYGVRPAISLKTCTLWKSGNGSPENPYEIEETESGC